MIMHLQCVFKALLCKCKGDFVTVLLCRRTVRIQPRYEKYTVFHVREIQTRRPDCSLEFNIYKQIKYNI